MKSVAIVTIQSMNCGNRLQNYALQEILKSYNLKVYTLKRGKRPDLINSFIIKLKDFIKIVINSKSGRFLRFDKKIKYAKYYLESDYAIEGLENEFDYFVVGSDQVWNPYYNFVGKSDLLYFAKHNQKISYAASFGVSAIPYELKDTYKKYLSDFSAISVREGEGSKIVKELIDYDAIVVLDPTLMLDADEWRRVSKRTNVIPKGKYTFVYILGDYSDDIQYAIDEQRKKGFVIFDVKEKRKNGKQHPTGPREFLYLIDKADTILTDSFHASVFSILFHKKVQTFRRSGIDMSSRIETLFEELGLQKFKLSNGEYCVISEDEYMQSDKILEIKREQSKKFLNDALGGGS